MLTVAVEVEDLSRVACGKWKNLEGDEFRHTTAQFFLRCLAPFGYLSVSGREAWKTWAGY